MNKLFEKELMRKPTIDDVKVYLINKIEFNWIERKIPFLKERKVKRYLNKNLQREYLNLLEEYNKNSCDTISNLEVQDENIITQPQKVSNDNNIDNERCIIKNCESTEKYSECVSGGNLFNEDVDYKDKEIISKTFEKSKLQLYINEHKVYDTVFSLGFYDELFEEYDGIYKDYNSVNGLENYSIKIEDNYDINTIMKHITEEYIYSINDYELDFDDETFMLMKMENWDIHYYATERCIEELEYWYDYGYDDDYDLYDYDEDEYDEDEYDEEVENYNLDYIYMCEDESSNDEFKELNLKTLASSKLYDMMLNGLTDIINNDFILKSKLISIDLDEILRDEFNWIFDIVFENYNTYGKEEMDSECIEAKVDYICEEYSQCLLEILKRDIVEREYKRIVLEDKEEIQLIKSICNNRQIDGLIHFTNIDNLASILKLGIVPVSLHDAANICSEKNDNERMDNHLEYTSFSVGFPNYRFLYSLRANNPDKKFAIIKLKNSVLWEKYRMFCVHNAADSRITNKNPLILSKAYEFGFMFDSTEAIDREELNIPNNFTTDPQAEVLIEGVIEADYIEEIIFSNYTDLNIFKNNTNINNKIKLKVDNYYFKPRIDYMYW